MGGARLPLRERGPIAMSDRFYVLYFRVACGIYLFISRKRTWRRQESLMRKWEKAFVVSPYVCMSQHFCKVVISFTTNDSFYTIHPPLAPDTTRISSFSLSKRNRGLPFFFFFFFFFFSLQFEIPPAILLLGRS